MRRALAKPIIFSREKLMGFASLFPSYALFDGHCRDLIPQSMQRTCSLSLSVPPHTPDVTMDHRVKPGGDAVDSLWSILHVEFESPD
jgi:hypothetical protein